MKPTDRKNSDTFNQKVSDKARLKLNAQKKRKQSVWFGLGMIGLVGWSVVLPTLLGISLGIWLDHNYPESFSWTLMLLISGLFVGCVIAWKWVIKERKDIDRNDKEGNDE